MNFKSIDWKFLLKDLKIVIVESFYSQNGFKTIKKDKNKKIFLVKISDYLKSNKKNGPIKINYAK